MFAHHVIHQLAPYCHGELTDEEARRVAVHLRQCPRCRSEWEALELADRLAGSLTRASAPASMWERIETALEPPSSRAAAWWSFLWPAALPDWRTSPALGVGLVLLLGVVLAWRTSDRPRSAWVVQGLEGTPRVGTAAIRDIGRLRVGQWLETDTNSRARIDVADIGQVEVEPNTRIGLLRSRRREHRLSLQRGKMSAMISAPPRLFFVNTPSAVAVDMGCAYTLEVDDAGRGLLHVDLGWVAFERDGREVTVPAGSMCETRPGIGPGTPYFDDAPRPLRTALAQLDFEGGGSQALDVILASARWRDAYTLWHLLPRVTVRERVRVYDRLAQLTPHPPTVNRAGVLRLDPLMLDHWKSEIEEGWWD